MVGLTGDTRKTFVSNIRIIVSFSRLATRDELKLKGFRVYYLVTLQIVYLAILVSRFKALMAPTFQ